MLDGVRETTSVSLGLLCKQSKLRKEWRIRWIDAKDWLDGL